MMGCKKKKGSKKTALLVGILLSIGTIPTYATVTDNPGTLLSVSGDNNVYTSASDQYSNGVYVEGNNNQIHLSANDVYIGYTSGQTSVNALGTSEITFEHNLSSWNNGARYGIAAHGNGKVTVNGNYTSTFKNGVNPRSIITWDSSEVVINGNFKADIVSGNNRGSAIENNVNYQSAKLTINGTSTIVNNVGDGVRNYGTALFKGDADFTVAVVGLQLNGGTSYTNFASKLKVTAGNTGIWMGAGARLEVAGDTTVVSNYTGTGIALQANSQALLHKLFYESNSNSLGVSSDGASTLIQFEGGSFVKTNAANATAMSATNGGTITGTGATEVVSGGQGLISSGTNSKITLGSGSSIQLTAPASSIANYSAVQALNGGQVQLYGTHIYADNSNNIAAIIADQNGVVNGSGTFNILGNVVAQNTGSIAFNLTDQSYLRGTVTTDSTSTSNLRLGESSYWGVTGSSNVSTLDLNNSLVAMTQDGDAFNTLTMKTLQGTGGLFDLDIDATQVNVNDRLYITDTFTGTQALALHETSGAYVGQEAIGTVLARVNDNLGSFTAIDGEGTLFWQRYELDSKAATDDMGYTTDWYLAAIKTLDKDTTTTSTIQAMGALNYYNWREMDTLVQRMGDLRTSGEKSNGIWVRAKRNQSSKSGLKGFKNQMTHFELGYDTTVKSTDEGTRYQGFSVSYAKGNNQYTYGGGDSKQISASFYQTDIRKSGHYLDLIARLSQSESNFSVYDSRHRLITGKISTPGVSISAEYGRKKSLSHSWYIEPQVQFTLGYLGGDDYTTSNKAHVSQNGITSAIGRIGFNVGRDLGHKGNVYLKANLLHEFAGNYGVTMSDYMVTLYRTDTFKDTWFEYGLGVNYALNDNSSVYFDIERSTGGGYTLDWQWNGGIRWKF